MDKFLNLVEQVILLLGQASLSVSYTRRLNILKMITKDPRKAKAMLKENENILKESKTHLLRKKVSISYDRDRISRKKSLKAFKDVGEKKSPFRKGTSHNQNKSHDATGGAITTRGNQVIETNKNMVNSKVRFNIIAEGNFNMEVQQHIGKYLFRKSKSGPKIQDRSSSKKIIYGGNTKCTTGRKATTVYKTVGKNYVQPINFFNCEGVSDTIYKSPSSGEASKHNKNVRATFSASGKGNIRVARSRKQKQLKKSV